MAGDWIKMRVNLVTHPKVLLLAELMLSDASYLEWSGLSFGMAGYPAPSDAQHKKDRYAALRVTRYVCVTSLLRFWGYANEHAKGEYIECLTADDVDDIAGTPGFSKALEAIGWCRFGVNGGVSLPGFLEHNTSAEARKSGSAERQKAYRERLKAKAESALKSDVTRDVTSHAREEKRREEKKTPPTPKGAERFSEFWASWPKSDRKGGKAECQKVWGDRGYDAIANEILTHVKAMAKSEGWTKQNGEFVPAPVVYLRGQRWDGAEVMPENAFEGSV